MLLLSRNLVSLPIAPNLLAGDNGKKEALRCGGVSL
jgi:hypothetical protein